MLTKPGKIKCDPFSGVLSEELRHLRYSVYSVDGIGFIKGRGYVPISSKWQYRKIDESIVEAIKLRNNNM